MEWTSMQWINGYWGRERVEEEREDVTVTEPGRS